MQLLWRYDLSLDKFLLVTATMVLKQVLSRRVGLILLLRDLLLTVATHSSDLVDRTGHVVLIY